MRGHAGLRRVRQARDHVGAGASQRGGRRGGRVSRRARPCCQPAAVVRGPPAGRRGGRRATGEPGPSPGRAQGPGCPPVHAGPGGSVAHGGRRAAGSGDPDRRPGSTVRRAAHRVGPGRPPGRPRRRSCPAAGAGARRLPRDRRGPRRAGRDRGLARLPGPCVRGRDRYRIDDDRRPPGEPGRWHDPGQRRRDEPADPVRRGPDEPGQLRDDARGRRARTDGRGAQGARRPDRDAGQSGWHQAGGDPGAGPRRQPDHAPPGRGHRPHAARVRAVRPGRGYGARTAGRGAGPPDPSRARGPMSCRASPDMSGRIPPASSSPRSRTSPST